MSQIVASREIFDGAQIGQAPRLRRLPDPNYEEHPAYGRLFGTPSLSIRAKAIMQLAPWIGLVLFKRLVLFDRLPALPDYSGPMGDGIGGRLAALRRYGPLVLRGLVTTVWRGLFAHRERTGGPKIAMLRRDGAVAVRFRPEEIDTIRREIAAPLAALCQRRAAANVRTFEGNQVWLNRQRSEGVYAVLQEVLGANGVLDDVSAYLGRPVSIVHVTLQLNDATDTFHHNKFSDIGLPDPATNYMHVDTTDQIMKFMIYLNTVSDTRGPFCYVLGSANLQIGWFEGLVRRAVDRSGLSGYAVRPRELFMALPKPLRRKCTFGSDLLDGSDDVSTLISAEHRFTSADGDAILFDNLGIHRGALVEEGQRQILIVTLA